MKETILAILLLAGLSLGTGCDGTSKADAAQTNNTNLTRLDKVLARLNDRAADIKTYRCDLTHISRQPLFDSQAIRKGKLYYYRDESKNLLRINFDTIKQDEQPTEDYKEQFIFDGVWLTRIDYQLKEVKRHQLVDPNELKSKGADAFDLLSEHLPIVGFTGTDNLKKQFNIKLVDANENEPNNSIKLHMQVKPDSIYKDDWVWIDFRIDKQIYLPAEVTTLTTEEDVFEIKFINAMLNEPMDIDVFDANVPEGFTIAEEVPLKNNN